MIGEKVEKAGIVKAAKTARAANAAVRQTGRCRKREGGDSGIPASQILRTDLAMEEQERAAREDSALRGVAVREWMREDLGMKITSVQVLNERGAKAMGKEKGSYLTLEVPGLEKRSEAVCGEIEEELAVQLSELVGRAAPKKNGKFSVLVAGLGNLYVTPDSLGPRVLENLTVTRLITDMGSPLTENRVSADHQTVLSGIVPGVMAQTGMETAEILKGIVAETRPDLLIAIDALAARSVHRLGCTIQLTDTGISPGSGVGNHRQGLNREVLGIPVLAIGVPTVVGAAAIVMDTMGAMIQAFMQKSGTRKLGNYLHDLNQEEQYGLIRELLEPDIGPMYVTPPDIGERVEKLGRLIAGGINHAFS